MAPRAGSTPTQIDTIPEVPDGIRRDRWDRPLIVPPGGGKPIGYARASSFGAVIEDKYHLGKWSERNVAFGLGRRPDLAALAASVAANEGDERAALDDIVEKAKQAAAGDKGANVGTALHRLSERREAGERLDYLTPDLTAALDAYTDAMKPFRVLASETFVVHDGLRAAGTFDRVVELLVDMTFGDVTLPAGTVVVLDLKTGKLDSRKYWHASYAVQQTVYAHGVPYTPRDGRIPWDLVLNTGDPVVSQRWALILHVPCDNPDATELLLVDLDLGAQLAELAAEIRQARKVKGLFAPCTAATAPQPPATDLHALIAAAPDEATLDAIWEQHGETPAFTPAHLAAMKARLAEIDGVLAQYPPGYDAEQAARLEAAGVSPAEVREAVAS